jgi:hypothetical protein
LEIQPVILFTIQSKNGYPMLCLKLIGNKWEKASVSEHKPGIRFLKYVNQEEPVWSNMETNERFETYAGNQVGQPPTPTNALTIYHDFKKASPDWDDTSSFQELAFIYSYVGADHH